MPEINNEIELLVILYEAGAVNEKDAVPFGDSDVEREIVEELIKMKRINETKDGGIYLTRIGVIIAKRNLHRYPELRYTLK